MNISSKRLHKLKYKIKNQSAKKYKNKHKRKKGGYLSKKKNKKYNLKNKSMKIKRKNQKGGSTPSPSIRILTDYTGLNLNNTDITTIPVRATLSNITINKEESENILSEIQNKQNEIQETEKKIEEQKNSTKTQPKKSDINKLADLDEKLENKVDELEELLKKNINLINDGLKINMKHESKKEVSAFIINNKIIPFYSFLFNNDKI